MSEIRPNLGPSPRARDYVRSPEKPEIQRPIGPDAVGVAIAASGLRSILHPPELQFENQPRLGGPRFEAQAILSLKWLKEGTEESTIDKFAEVAMEFGPDVEAFANVNAKRGMAELNQFLQNSAVMLAMKSGPLNE